MQTHRPIMRMLGIAGLSGTVLCTVACAPERIPGSSIEQGDAGVAFRRAAQASVGSGASNHTRANASAAVPHGGGSSGSPRRGSQTPESSALLATVQGCDWFRAPGATTAAAPDGWDRTKGVGMEGWFAANCIGSGELR